MEPLIFWIIVALVVAGIITLRYFYVVSRQKKKGELMLFTKKTLTGKKFVIMIRTKDGKKCDYESAIISSLINAKAIVTAATPEREADFFKGDHSSLNTNQLAITGYYKPGTGHDEGYLSPNCDIRIYNTEGTILAAGNVDAYSNNAWKVVHFLAKDLAAFESNA